MNLSVRMPRLQSITSDIDINLYHGRIMAPSTAKVFALAQRCEKNKERGVRYKKALTVSGMF